MGKKARRCHKENFFALEALLFVDAALFRAWFWSFKQDPLLQRLSACSTYDYDVITILHHSKI